MISALCLLLLSTPTSAAAEPATRATSAVGSLQDPAPAPNTNPDKRPELEEMLDKLEKHMRKEGKEDTEAVALIDLLFQEFPKSGPKDRAAIVKTLSKSFEQRRLVPDGQPPNNKLNVASAAALGYMGPESVDVLTQWIDHKNLRKDLALQYQLIKALGKTKDKRGIKTLKLMLEHKENSLGGAAAEALGEFEGADQATRKEVFEMLLKVLMSTKGQRDADANNVAIRDRYDVIAAPIITSLGHLAKHDERDPEKWQNWWNKNKKNDWDKAD
jgi:hypothetical protein